MRKKSSNIPFYIVLILIICLCVFIYLSPKFERTPPTIEVPNMTYWNLKWDIPIKISDSSGIKSYRVSIINGNDVNTLLEKHIDDEIKTNIEFNLPIPKISISNGDTLKYKIDVVDNSKYHFFLGNSSEKKFDITIDTKSPQVGIIAMSNKITRGGSGVVVFFAKDDNLANISLSNGYESFVAFPFLKKGYYVSIIPWSIHNPNFKGRIIVEDKAGNIRRSNIGFARYARNYRTSNLTLKDSFIDDKISSIIENSSVPLDSFKSRLEMFKYVNNVIRGNDEKIIYSKILNLDLNNNYQINTFKPLKDYVIVGLFGDHRKFMLDKEPAGESYHLGIDLANIKNAQVFASNDGVVVLKESLGIYGNTIIIDHGFGLSTLYSHLSESYVKEGDIVKKGDVIARTGATGLAFGDHLHFGVLIQGVFALSPEWMDSRWLKVNINDVLSEAVDIIENKQ